MGVSERLYWQWRVYFNALHTALCKCVCGVHVGVCVWVCVGVHVCVFAFANFYIEIYHTRNFKPTGESKKNKTAAKSYANQVEVSMRFEIKLNNHFNKLKRILSD